MCRAPGLTHSGGGCPPGPGRAAEPQADAKAERQPHLPWFPCRAPLRHQDHRLDLPDTHHRPGCASAPAHLQEAVGGPGPSAPQTPLWGAVSPACAPGWTTYRYTCSSLLLGRDAFLLPPMPWPTPRFCPSLCIPNPHQPLLSKQLLKARGPRTRPRPFSLSR